MLPNLLAALQASPMPTMSAPPATPAETGRGHRPLGVTILAVLGALAGLVMVLAGVAAAVLGSVLSAAIIPIPGLAVLGAAMAVVLGIVLLVLGLAALAMAYGFWNGLAWSWTLALLLTVLGMISAVASMVSGDILSGALSLLIDVALIWYYTREGVQRWFGNIGAWPAGPVNSVLGSGAK